MQWQMRELEEPRRREQQEVREAIEGLDKIRRKVAQPKAAVPLEEADMQLAQSCH